MSYEPTVWEDFPSLETQIDAAKLNKIENQLVRLSNYFEIPNNVDMNRWYYIGRVKMAGTQGQFTKIVIFGGAGQNSRTDQNFEMEIFLKKGWQEQAGLENYVGVTYNLIQMDSGATLNDVKVKVLHSNFQYLDVYVYFSWGYAGGGFQVEGNYDNFEYKNEILNIEPTSGTEQACKGGIIRWS